MPYEDPDPTDPLLGVAIGLPVDFDAVLEQAYVFAEEFAAMGHDADWILHMFRTPFYAGAHAAYRQLGDARIRSVIDECIDVWGRVRWVNRDAELGAPADAPVGPAPIPVLDPGPSQP